MKMKQGTGQLLWTMTIPEVILQEQRSLGNAKTGMICPFGTTGPAGWTRCLMQIFYKSTYVHTCWILGDSFEVPHAVCAQCGLWSTVQNVRPHTVCKAIKSECRKNRADRMRGGSVPSSQLCETSRWSEINWQWDFLRGWTLWQRSWRRCSTDYSLLGIEELSNTPTDSETTLILKKSSKPIRYCPT